MIVKKVPNKKKSSTKAARVSGLADYIINPERENGKEKCIYSGAENFITDTHEAQKSEMIALSQEAVKSKDPIDHWVLSWKSNEHPTTDQAKQAVEMFIKHLGLNDHQYIWGLHDDTENLHVHIQVNRVHPDTLKVTKVNKGFDLNAAHEAIAIIEHAQGWKKETNARFDIADNKPIARDQDPNKQKKPGSRQQDMEIQTGTKSAERIAIELAAPIIQKAASWQDLHQQLAAHGMRYEQKGSGALLFVGDIAIKPSDIHRSASLPKLQSRLGLFEQASHDIVVAKRSAEPQPLKPHQKGWGEYIAIKKAHDQSKLAMDKQQTTEKSQLAAKLKAERADLNSVSWKGKGEFLNEARSVLASKQAEENLELEERHRAQRQQYTALPQYKEWLTQPAMVGTLILDERSVVSQLKAPALSTILKSLTLQKKNGHVTYRSKGAALFVDEGRRLQMVDEHSEIAIAAALAVAKQKFGYTLTLTGPAEFQRRTVEVAVKNNLGIKFADPGLENYRQSLMEKQNALSNRNQHAKSIPPAHLRNRVLDLSNGNLVLNGQHDELPLQQDVHAGLEQSREQQNSDLQRQDGRASGARSSRDTRADPPSTSSAGAGDIDHHLTPTITPTPSTRPNETAVRAGVNGDGTGGSLTENPSERSGLHADIEGVTASIEAWRSGHSEMVETQLLDGSGRVLHVFSDGQWIQNRNRGLQFALQPSSNIEIKVGQNVEVDRRGSVKLITGQEVGG